MARHDIRTGNRWFIAALLALALALAAGIWAMTHQYDVPEVPSAAATANASTAPLPSATGSAPPSSSSAASQAGGVPAPSSSDAGKGPSPTKVSIPTIGVSLELIHLGLQADGTMAVPSGSNELKGAWFTGSPSPGSLGPAVIEAHVTTATGRGPFFKLATVRSGDAVAVSLADGSTANFTVYQVSRYAKDNFPTGLVYGNTAAPELRLITCGGDFDRSTGHFDDNTVVYARMASAT